MNDDPSFYPESETFSRQQMQATTGVPDDVLAFWIKQGLLVALPSGPRAHRRFLYEQLHIAVILNAMRSLGANVGVLRKFALGLQHGFELFRKSNVSRDEAYYVASLAKSLNKYRSRAPVKVYDFEDGEYEDRLAKNEEDIINLWIKDRRRDGQYLESVVPFAQDLDSYDANWLDYALELIQLDILSGGEEYNYVWLAWVDQAGEALIDGAENANISNPNRPPATFYISVSQLIRPMWRQRAKDAEEDLRIRRHNHQILELMRLEQDDPGKAKVLRARHGIPDDWADTYKLIGSDE